LATTRQPRGTPLFPYTTLFRSGGGAPAHRLERFGRLGAVDHPGRPEAVGAHAEAVRPEGLLEGHGDGAALGERLEDALGVGRLIDRKSTRLNSSHRTISYAVFC